MGLQAQVGAGSAGADQCEAGLPVLFVVASRVALVELADQHAHRAGHVPALPAGRGKGQAGTFGGVEHVLVHRASHALYLTIGTLELDGIGARGLRLE